MGIGSVIAPDFQYQILDPAQSYNISCSYISDDLPRGYL